MKILSRCKSFNLNCNIDIQVQLTTLGASNTTEGATMREEEVEVAIKVVVVGNGAVGKSSMIQRYCKGIFTRDYKKTIGVDFLERQIEYVHFFFFLNRSYLYLDQMRLNILEWENKDSGFVSFDLTFVNSKS